MTPYDRLVLASAGYPHVYTAYVQLQASSLLLTARCGDRTYTYQNLYDELEDSAAAIAISINCESL